MALAVAASPWAEDRPARAQIIPPGPGEIAVGIFEPGAPGDAKLIDRIAAEIGRMPAFIQWYEAWGSPLSRYSERLHIERLRAVDERGAIPFITWEPWVPELGVNQPEYAPALIAAGAYDAYLRTWAEPMALYGKPIYLRMFHEMNAEWYPWGAVQPWNTPEDLIAAWRHVWQVFQDAEAFNVRFVWCPDAGVGKVALNKLYPGDDYVDWVGLDGYNWGLDQPDSEWRSFDDIFGVAYRALIRLSQRPVMIAETASVESGGDKAAWITEAFAALPQRYTRVKAFAWFNEKQPNGNFPVNSSSEALAAYQLAIAQPGLQAPLEYIL
ncbi:MAG: glycoside hydrolase family 26 protein [Thermomicrobiales bacterium]